MRLKKVLFKLVLLVMIFIIVTLSILIFTKKDETKTDYAILLGNPLENQISIEYDDTFTSEFMNSSYLLKLFKHDASKSVDGKLIKLSSLIKDSSVVIVNIGSFEIKSLITDSYDEEIIDRTIDVYLNNLDDILNNINNNNQNIQMYVCNIKYTESNYDKTLINIFSSLNESIRIIAKKNNAKML